MRQYSMVTYNPAKPASQLNCAEYNKTVTRVDRLYSALRENTLITPKVKDECIRAFEEAKRTLASKVE